MHYCSRDGTYRIASFLVDRGADVNIRNKSGKSPLDVAKLGKHNDIVELLEKAVLEGPHGMLIACFQLRIILYKQCCLGPAITPPIHSHSTHRRSIPIPHTQLDHMPLVANCFFHATCQDLTACNQESNSSPLLELDVSELVLGPLAYTTISMCTHPCWSIIQKQFCLI